MVSGSVSFVSLHYSLIFTSVSDPDKLTLSGLVARRSTMTNLLKEMPEGLRLLDSPYLGLR